MVTPTLMARVCWWGQWCHPAPGLGRLALLCCSGQEPADQSSGQGMLSAELPAQNPAFRPRTGALPMPGLLFLPQPQIQVPVSLQACLGAVTSRMPSRPSLLPRLDPQALSPNRRGLRLCCACAGGPPETWPEPRGPQVPLGDKRSARCEGPRGQDRTSWEAVGQQGGEGGPSGRCCVWSPVPSVNQPPCAGCRGGTEQRDPDSHCPREACAAGSEQCLRRPLPCPP